MGTLVGRNVRDMVTSGGDVKLKWPNDILINNEKVSCIIFDIILYIYISI